jgi:diadenosine tetraphosphate (Ap4A) HIT family hydrolase
MSECMNCDLNRRSDAGEDPTFVARTKTGYVRVNANQFYAGYTYFVIDTCAAELHELDADERRSHLDEMALVAEAVFKGFGARKLNYEALGNSVPHLHWHLVPRHHDDPRPWAPIWENLDFLRQVWTGQAAEQATIDEARQRLLDALRATPLTISTSYR